MKQTGPEVLTPREREEWEQEKIATEMGFSHAKDIKAMELEVAKLEAKWSSWLKLPRLIVLLPVSMIMAIGFCISMVRDKEVPEDYWKFLR